jgi:hypothetical protein
VSLFFLAVSGETAKRLLELASEWERARLPLIEHLRGNLKLLVYEALSLVP